MPEHRGGTDAENDKMYEKEDTAVVRRRILLRKRIPQHRGGTDAENDKPCFGARVPPPHVRDTKDGGGYAYSDRVAESRLFFFAGGGLGFFGTGCMECLCCALYM